MIVASPRGKTKGPASRVPPGGGPKLSLTERVYAALKDIITGELMPGQAFTENDLAHRYTASRTPVREAAVRLQAEELVRIVANRGYFVTQLTIPPQALSELERTASSGQTMENSRLLSRPTPPSISVLRDSPTRPAGKSGTANARTN